MTEKDETGLNHTWFRKNENRAGRWTSPDPYNGSMNLGNPQSFNRYSYVENEPTNFVDPSGLIPWSGWSNLNNWGGINIGTFVVNVQISWFDWYWDSYFGAENGFYFGEPYSIPDLLDAVETIIEKAEKDPNSECAKLLGPDALRKFKEIKNKIEYNRNRFEKYPNRNFVNAETVDQNIYLNPDGFAFNPDLSFYGKGAEKRTKAVNKAITKSGARNRWDYAVATIIHEFLHTTGKFGPDASVNSDGTFNTGKSERNQKNVIEACLRSS